MKTLVLKTNRKSFKRTIRIAANLLSKGKIVAFPTETVYGLGVNAFDKKAIKKLFKVKKRPSDNPLIIHISEKNQVLPLVKKISSKASKLMNCFWPGPLTLVFKSSGKIPKEASGGLETIAIRMPDHKVALALINACGFPLAAPSANLAGKPSATNAFHVLEDFDKKIDCIIDAGKTRIGIESTVLDVSVKTPVLLRPGKITKEEIQKIIGKIKVHGSVKKGKFVKKLMIKSPGMKYRHYAPDAKVIIIPFKFKGKELSKKADEMAKGKTALITLSTSKVDCKKCDVIKARHGIVGLGKRLFAEFRRLDKNGYDTIIVHGVREKGFGSAIMNRLKKAARKK
ncbi:MAG: L-threonylcarbamoyladenylate synthase [Candidatus Diapherotrites archaeon]